MKKFTLALMALLSVGFAAKAQQYVSTEPANRNVIIEEFTGRNCGYCPDGHRIANEIMANNPGRVWAINVHAGGYAPTSYPNFNNSDVAQFMAVSQFQVIRQVLLTVRQQQDRAVAHGLVFLILS